MKVSFDDLEREKRRFLDRLSVWPAEKLHQQPAAGQWSAAQVVEHLVKTEREIVAEVTKALGGTGHRTGLRDILGVAMIDRVFRSPRKVKVPKSVTSVLPVDQVEYAEVLQQWSADREQLRSVIESAPSFAERRGLWRHPVGGWMNLPQTLNFFSSHIVHHHFQLDGIERAVAAARPSD